MHFKAKTTLVPAPLTVILYQPQTLNNIFDLPRVMFKNRFRVYQKSITKLYSFTVTIRCIVITFHHNKFYTRFTCFVQRTQPRPLLSLQVQDGMTQGGSIYMYDVMIMPTYRSANRIIGFGNAKYREPPNDSIKLSNIRNYYIIVIVQLQKFYRMLYDHLIIHYNKF